MLISYRFRFVLSSLLFFLYIGSFRTDLIFGNDFDIDSQQSMQTHLFQTDSNAFPQAVPILSAEEANKLNEEALKYQQKIKDTKQLNDKSQDSFCLVPKAVPILSPEEANKANIEAIKNRRIQFIKGMFHSCGLTKNRIFVLIALLPLLFLFDAPLRLFSPPQRCNRFFSLQRRCFVLSSISLLFFGLMVFVPWSVYFGNAPMFSFIFQDFLCENLFFLTLLIIATTLILLIIHPVVSNLIVSVVAGLGVCVYLQSMFMNCFLGEMNGTEQDWGQHRLWGIINIIIWLAVIFFFFFIQKLNKKGSAIISSITGAILVMEIVATGSMVISASNSVWERTGAYYVDASNQFQLSKTKNIFVIVFDTLGSEYIKLCFEKYPESEDIVKDFTWYYDARSNYQWTYPALLHEITGATIYPANDAQEMFDKAWESNSAISFYKQMKDLGYDTRLFIDADSLFGDKESYHNFYSNIVKRDITYVINKKIMSKCLFLISGFSSVPYSLKKFFFYDSDLTEGVCEKKVNNDFNEELLSFLPHGNNMFYSKLFSIGITTDASKPIMAFHYSMGVHPPWHIDEKCQKHKDPFDEPFPMIQSCFFILSDLIRQLKENNIYDQTAIFVISDHGSNNRKYSTPFDMGFMVKPFNTNQDKIVKDNSRIQSIDLLPTILYYASGNNKIDYSAFEGFPPSNIPHDRKRIVTRTVKDNRLPMLSGAGATAHNRFDVYLFEEEPSHGKLTFIRSMAFNKNIEVDDSIKNSE